MSLCGAPSWHTLRSDVHCAHARVALPLHRPMVRSAPLACEGRQSFLCSLFCLDSCLQTLWFLTLECPFPHLRGASKTGCEIVPDAGS